MLFRRRFADVVGRQLDLFAQDHGSLVLDCERALAAYERAAREEAEERYGDYLDLVHAGVEVLARLRDNFAAGLGDDAARAYVATFNRTVRKRLPRFGLELEDA